MNIKACRVFTMPVLSAFFFFLSCSKPFWMEDYGLQKIRYYLIIDNRTNDSLLINQFFNLSSETPSTKAHCDSVFVVNTNTRYLDSIDFEWVTRKEWNDLKPVFRLTTTMGNAKDIMVLHLNVSRNNIVQSFSKIIWDTAGGEWHSTWNEIALTYDTLIIQ